MKKLSEKMIYLEEHRDCVNDKYLNERNYLDKTSSGHRIQMELKSLNDLKGCLKFDDYLRMRENKK